MNKVVVPVAVESCLEREKEREREKEKQLWKEAKSMERGRERE